MPTQTRRLPLYVALAALGLYVCSMGGELTLNGLSLASKLAGWDDAPLVGQPLLWLLTLPLQALPAAWVPLLLKLFAAVLAAAILGVLTRTVQLLPWDHSWENAAPPGLALPWLTAAAVCGLEFSFWREATSTCGDLLDLLLLAAAIWLLLESKERRHPRWLQAAALIWGLGMAENWVMLLASPLFVTAVLWLRRKRFFRWRFILRLAWLGLAGFSVYAILPLANGWLPHSPWTWDQAWMASLRQTRNDLLLPHVIWQTDRFAALAMAICFLLPTLPLLVRMQDKGTRDRQGAPSISRVDRFELWIYRSLRLGLLLACCWLAFDPGAGARQMLAQLGVRSPLLTFDYLNALGAAFLAGNLLLISQSAVPTARLRARNRFAWRRLALPIATAGFVVVAGGLTVRNLPVIWRTNHHPLEQFGDLAMSTLPAGRGVMLSDFPDQLMVFQAALARGHRAADWLVVKTADLPSVSYRARLEQGLPAGWLTDRTRHELSPVDTLRLLEQVARTNRLFYLHPSHGHFFEGFYLEPTGLIYEMKLRGKNPLALPPLSSAALAANEQFWTQVRDQELVAPAPASPRISLWSAKLSRFCLAPAVNFQDIVLGEWCSIPLEAWGVVLQEQGRLREAQARFEQALRLNPGNLSARLSLACNTNLQAGVKIGLLDVSKLAGQLGTADRLNAILNSGGPFDEPTICYLLGAAYFDHGMLIQAAEQMERVRTLAPNSPAPELELAVIYNRLQMPDLSRRLINHLREETRTAPANSSLDLDLALQESYSWLLQTNPANARGALQSLIRQHPDDLQVAGRVMLAYLALGDVTNALQLVEERLAKSPDDVPALNDKSVILIQSGQAAAALPVLDHILALTNLPSARLNRAFARIATKDFALAKSELNELASTGPSAGMANFGLALVAVHGDDTNSASHYLQLCLSNTPAGSPLWQQASAHLRLLQPAK